MTTAPADTTIQEQEEIPQPTTMGRLLRRLFYNDPNDELTLQPHMDEKLTKKSELWAFFLFGFGYYSWANSCASLLLPILVQGVARRASHLESDPSVPCPDTDPENDRCLVPFGWINVTPTSYVLLTNVLTVWCTIVVTLGVSALADHGRISKRIMLVTSTMLCVIACFIFLGALEPSIWWLSAFLFLLSK
jgi:MFS-type transporter involved in bile tolerance (Atg22 family)